MKYLTYFSRFFVGVLFIISGLIKANDAIGFSYKLDEYFSADVLNLEFLIPLSLVMAAGICIVEIVLGLMVLIGSRPKLTNWSLMSMIIFFTFLTFYSAYFNKVTDCGCFGDAIKLTPWESFGKDIILMILIGILIKGEKYISPLLNNKKENMLIAIVTFFCFAFVIHTYRHLPIKDYRPYAIGKNIADGMKTCDELSLPCTEEAIVYIVKDKQSGETRDMLSTDYQEKWEEFDFVEATDQTILLQEGYEPPIHDFSIFKDGIDYTYSILEEKNAFLLVCYDITKTSTGKLDEINTFYQNCLENNIPFYALCASSDDNILKFKQDFNIQYPFYFTDETTLKTMIRSNPGLIMLNKGTVTGKWHSNDFPKYDDVINHIAC
ncbi:MAG: BT_3928 family protein [Flavobacteriales bacterium]